MNERFFFSRQLFLLRYGYILVYLGMFKGNLTFPLAVLCHIWNLIFCLLVVYVGSKKLSVIFSLERRITTWLECLDFNCIHSR